MDLSKYGKDLQNLIKVKNHPLEKYIIAIDRNLENPNLLKSIGESVGIDVYNDYDPAISLYLVLKDYLEREINVEETRRRINMTLTEFSKNYPKLNDEQTFTLYANRLLDE